MDESHESEIELGDAAPARSEGDSADSQLSAPPKGIPAVSEALGYVGGALALAAVIALLVTYWPQIGLVGHVALGATLAVAGLVGGFAFGRQEGAAAQRLSHFLLFAGVAGVGAAVGFGVRDLLVTYLPSSSVGSVARADAAEWGWFAGAAAVAVSGGLVWWRTRTILQHMVFGLGVAATALLALPLVPIEGPEWGAGATLIVVALVWGALSLRGLLPPSPAGVVLSALGLVGGLEMMALMAPTVPIWSLWLGAVCCAALVWAGSRIEEIGVLGIGAVGLTAFSGQLVGEYLGFGAGTALALIVLGFVLLGVGVRLTLRTTTDASRNRRIASEVIGYLGVAFAMGGAAVLMAQYWDDLGVAGRILVPLAGAVVAYTCAALLHRSETGAAHRLAQVLLAIGVLTSSIAAAMVAQPIAENVLGTRLRADSAVANWTMLAGAVAATFIGGVTWWFRKGSLTQIAFLVGVVMIVISAINFLGPDSPVPFWALGAVNVAIGTVWVALGAAERIVPVRTALVGGCIVTLQGLQMMMSGEGGFYAWAGVLGIGFGIVAIAASIYLKRAILLGFGALAIIMFSMATMLEVFGGRAGVPILLLVMGVVFIAVAAVTAKVAPRIRRTPKSPNLPKAPLPQG